MNSLFPSISIYLLLRDLMICLLIVMSVNSYINWLALMSSHSNKFIVHSKFHLQLLYCQLPTWSSLVSLLLKIVYSMGNSYLSVVLPIHISSQNLIIFHSPNFQTISLNSFLHSSALQTLLISLHQIESWLFSIHISFQNLIFFPSPNFQTILSLNAFLHSFALQILLMSLRQIESWLFSTKFLNSLKPHT